MSQAMQPMRSLPDELHQLAETNALGLLKETWYYRTKLPSFGQIIGLFFFYVFVMGFLGGLLIAICWTLTPFWITELVIVLVIASPFCFALFPYLKGVYHRADLVALYTNGFIQRSGKQMNVFSWAAIDQIWRGLASPDKKSIVDIDLLRLKQLDGGKFVLKPAWDVDFRAALCDAIERGFIQTHLPSVMERYESGQVIDFGDIAVSQEGIRKASGTLLPWSNVERTEVGSEYVLIRQEGRTSDWFRCLICDFPNACLLKSLLEEIR